MGLLYFAFVNRYGSAFSQNGLFWSKASDLPDHDGFIGLSRHSAIIHKDVIYVIGGGKDLSVQTKDVYTGEIKNFGFISQWGKNGTLTDTLIYAPAAVTENGCIYLVGGRSGNRAKSSVIFGQTNSNSPVNWQTVNIPNFSARYLHSVIIYEDTMFALGGFNETPNPHVIPTVSYLKLTNNCSVPGGPWVTTTPLTFGRAAHTAVAFNRRIYVIGGFEGGTSPSDITSSVSYANIQSNGLSNWVPSTVTLPIGLAYHTAFVSKATRRIYVVGGLMQSGKISPKVYSAYVQDNGQLVGDPHNPTKWQEETNFELPVPLYRHATVLADNGSVYVIGGQTKDENGNDQNQSQVYYFPPLTLTKTNNPPGPVHESDVITYTISYANTSLKTQTITITDVLPFNVNLLSASGSPTRTADNSTLIWPIGDIAPGEADQVSFNVQVPLFLSVTQTSPSLTPFASAPTAHILPATVTCDTTRFWAAGVTRQPPVPGAYTLQVQIPPGAHPSQMWLMMKGTANSAPLVGGQAAELITATNQAFGASWWTAPITPTMIAHQAVVTVTTENSRNLNALFLFDEDDPPFQQTVFDAFYQSPYSKTYTLDIPSVATQTIDVILPLMDITTWTDDNPPQVDLRQTHLTAEFNGQTRALTIDNPNMGNGLVMAQLLFDIGRLPSGLAVSKTLTLTVNTEDSVYTLSPRVCRPVYIENTAWLCSQQAGCISDTVRNAPSNIRYPGEIYLPIIFKSGS